MQSTVLEKRCPKCSETKTIDGWNRNRGRRDGLAVWCKLCIADYQKKRLEDPEIRAKTAQRAAQRYASMSDDDRAAYIQAGTERRRKTGYHLRQKYGISIEEYDFMLFEQGGGCAICGKPPSNDRRLAVDHDHTCCPGDKTCGKCIRGLLCLTCNVWLGFYENEEWMNRASAYLDRRIAKELERE